MNDKYFQNLKNLIEELHKEDPTITKSGYFLILNKLGYISHGVYSVPEIAEILGVSKNTIYLDYRATIKKLEKLLYDIKSYNED